MPRGDRRAVDTLDEPAEALTQNTDLSVATNRKPGTRAGVDAGLAHGRRVRLRYPHNVEGRGHGLEEELP
jgi:hypothetical protein